MTEYEYLERGFASTDTGAPDQYAEWLADYARLGWRPVSFHAPPRATWSDAASFQRLVLFERKVSTERRS